MNLISRVGMVIVAAVLATIGVLGPYPGNTPAALAASDVGYRDFSFSANAVSYPTGEKPQSKLWFNDGVWWASLFDRSTEEYHIYRYDWAAHTWSDTGTLIDERNTSKADVLWDGTHLYVVSAGSGLTNSSHAARILRYSYDPATKRYTRDNGFPVTITNAGLETIVLDKDTTGKLWVTYTQDKKVYVNRSLGNDQTWGTPFVLPVNGTDVRFDDISSVVAFDSQIGVMWSNQIDDAMYFATHTDGDPDDVWQGSRAAIQGPKNADDHISLRSLQAADSSGRVFAAVKTSLNDLQNPNPNAPLNLLLVRDREGNWTNHVFGRVGDDHTRPIVMLDEEHRDLYVFATAPCCDGGAIYYKKTNLNNISFSEGLGEPFIKSTTDVNINNATSTKQNLSSATGLLVMASDNVSDYYVHNAVNLDAVDSIPPETSIDSGPSGTVNDSSASFAFSSTEPDSTFECALDGASFSGCTSPQNYTNLSDGSHTFQVRATDAAGNTDTTPAERSWTVDTTAPVVDSVAPPADATDVAVATNVEATFSEAMDASTLTTATFTLVEQGSTTPVAAAVSYDSTSMKAILNSDGDLQAGTTYTATVKTGAKDVAGNALAAEKAWSFTTVAPPPPDTTPPNTTLTAPTDGAVVAGTSVTLSADATDNFGVDRVEFLVNANVVGTDATAPYSVSWDSTTLQEGDGRVTIVARAFDPAGNSTTSAGREVIVNNTLPETTITVGPSGTVNSATATFEFASSERDSTFRCKLDNKPAFTECASPKTYTGLTDGEYTFQVKAVGAAGEVDDSDGTPASRTWTVDTTAPEAPVITSPAENSHNNTGNVVVSGTAEPGSTVELFDAAASVGIVQATASGDWSKELGGVAEGSHTYTAKATDAAGNTSAASNARTVIIDMTPPDTTIISGPSETTNSASATFEFSSTEPDSSFECKLDAGAFESCASPKSYSNLSDGSHIFEVRATDAAGNTDATPASRSWTVDTTAPTISGVTPADGATSVALTTNVEASFSEAMDASTTNGSTFTLVKQGIDASLPLLGDTPIAATVSYDAQAKKAVLNPNEDLEAGATYKATVKGGTNGVKDIAGNPLGADKAWSFTTAAAPLADTTPPETTIDSGPAGLTNDSTPTFTFSGSDDVTSSADLLYSHKVDNGEWSAYSGGTSTTVGGDTGFPDGPHTFYVKAKDGAGNEDPNPAERSFTVDTRAPETTIDSGPLGTVNSTAASFAFSSSEGDSTFECGLDGAAFTGCTSPKDYANLSDGSHTFEVRATDATGNTDATPAKRTWTVDTTAPAVQPPAHGFVENSTLGKSTVPVKLTWSATDDSGVAGYQLQQSTNGGAYKNVSLPSATATTITPSLTPGNTYQFQVRAQDQVGNWSSWTPGPRFWVDAYQESDAAISYLDLWRTQTLNSAFGGALKYAKGLGTEKATFVFTGSEIAWVAPTNSNRGQAEVYLDGTKVATVDLYSASGKSRTVVFSKAGLDPSVTHTLEVRVLGTKNAASTGKRVDVDAFVVLR